LLDQRRDHAFSVLVGDLDQHHIAGLPLNQRGNVAVPGASYKVAFPMTGYSTIFNTWRPISDRDCILDLSQSIALEAGVPGAADSSLGPKMLQKFLLQHATGLNVQASIDCLM
jgi:hypothetical protein